MNITETKTFKLNKETLKLFIKKYNLNGLIESAKWVCKDGILYTNFLTTDKSLLGTMKLNSIDSSDFELGIYNTSSLLSFLNVFNNDELTIKLIYDMDKSKILAIDMKDGLTSATFVASDSTVVPSHKGTKEEPDYFLEEKLNDIFIKSYVKSYSALSDIKQVALVKDEDKVKLIIGHSKNNTSKISLDIPCKLDPTDLLKPMYFNSSYLKEIFTANSDVDSCNFNVSDKGICNIEFSTIDWDVKYYLIGNETTQN